MLDQTAPTRRSLLQSLAALVITPWGAKATRPEPEPEPGPVVSAIFEFPEPGIYELLIWTDREWDRLDHADRPGRAWRHGAYWVAMEAAPREGGDS